MEKDLDADDVRVRRASVVVVVRLSGDYEPPKVQCGPSVGKRGAPVDQSTSSGTAVGRTPLVLERRRQVVLLGVLGDGATGAVLRGQLGHAGAHARQPHDRQAVVVARVELGNHLALQQRVERIGVGGVASGGVAMLAAVADRPAHVGLVRFVPPAVQLRQVEATVDQNLHAARATRLPRAQRRVDPHVDAADELLGQQHVVVAQEEDLRSDAELADELQPLSD